MEILEIISFLEKKLAKWEMGIHEARTIISYLKKYGYINSIKDIKIGDIIEAIKAFQMLAGLDTDGEVGPKTFRAMSWPRCSLPDFYLHDNVLSMEVLEAKWGRKEITYFIEKRDSDIPANEWDNIIEKAYQQWSDVANLKFSRVDSRNSANIIMSIGNGPRDDFDGPSGTLAWAQLPPNNNYNGQLLLKFDAAESWNKNIYLLNVACHEVGHNLGLGHSRMKTALMAPFYSHNVSKPQDNDDIKRIVELYGPPSTMPIPPVDIKAPSELKVEKLTNGFKLTWKDNSTGEDGFEIWRNDNLEASVNRGITTVSDIDLVNGTYVYKIRAKVGNNFSGWSNQVTAIWSDNPEEPNPDENLVITISGKVNSINIPGYRVTKIG